VRRYLLLDEIGRGASGSVHAAWDQRRRRYVAVKVLAPGAPGPGPRLAHPHVLATIACVTQGDAVLVVMDLVRGGSLLDLRAESGRLPEAYVAVVLDQVLQALVAVHASGVVHRDVKPANLLLDATGAGRPYLRLADFGDETTIGTPGYLAPERESGAAVHPSQDVYAAGILAGRLLDRPGPLTTLADTMSRTDPALRPTAAQALARLRSLPVPRAGGWPRVPDRLGPLPHRR
jgi:eukaryotic-like serine/threonine-protein kinase